MLDNTQNPAAGQADKPDNLIEASPAVAAMVGKPATWDGIEGFVQHLWGEWLARTKGILWTTAFASSAGGEFWHGRPGLDWMRARFGSMDADLYVAIGVMQAGSARRSLGNVVAQPVLIVDDIGTKVDPAKWEALFALGCPRPTAQVQTSAGNETWFWLLDGDATSADHAAALRIIRAWLVEQKLTDDVMDTTRYVRLPGGWNSKEKHQGPGGPGDHPRVMLTAWRPGAVSLEDLGRTIVGLADGAMDGLVGGADAWRVANAPKGNAARAMLTGAQLGAGAGGALARTADLGRPDALMRLAQELGLNLTQRGPGVVEALCPNIGAHTTRADTGFAFLGSGLMHCNHAACQGLTTVDFRSMMQDQYDERQAGRLAVGALGPDEPKTAVEFMARETVRDAGGLLDTADVVAQAGQMAASSAARLQREAKGEDGEGKRKRALHEIALDLMQLNGIVPYTDRKSGGVAVRVAGRWVNVSGSAGQNHVLGGLVRDGIRLHGTGAKHLFEILAALAAANKPVDVSYRVARSGSPENPTIYVNLMDDENRAVSITRDGWKSVAIADVEPVLMHRQGGLALPVPVSAGDGVTFLDRLVRHIPLAPIVRKDDPTDVGVMQRATLLTFCFAQFARWNAVPHLLMAGEQGGGKTTAARRLNGLTDPDAGAVLSRLASDEAKIFAQVSPLSNVVWDNTSSISPALADALCCLATGAAYATRRLYTNDERSLSSALCSVIFTSVLDGGITRRPDLQDRMLVLATPPLPKDKRRSESELDAAWSADLPLLLADLFDLVSTGLRHMADVRAAQRMGVFPPPPRFADVAQVAEAAAWRGLGWPAGLLTRALNNLRATAADDQLSDDPIAHRLRELLRTQPGSVWRGSYEELERAMVVIDGPTWDRHRVPLQGGVSRVLGPLRELWGIERREVGRKHCRIYEWRLTEASTSGDGLAA